MNPSQFIITSDYATLKNDATGQLSVTVPSSVVVGAGSTFSTSSSIEIGVAGASERSQIHSSKTGQYYVGNMLDIIKNGNAGGTALYDVFVDLSRTGPTTLTMTATIFNPYGVTLTGESGAETFTADVATFLPPFN